MYFPLRYIREGLSRESKVLFIAWELLGLVHLRGFFISNFRLRWTAINILHVHLCMHTLLRALWGPCLPSEMRIGPAHEGPQVQQILSNHLWLFLAWYIYAREWKKMTEQTDLADEVIGWLCQTHRLYCLIHFQKTLSIIPLGWGSPGLEFVLSNY